MEGQDSCRSRLKVACVLAAAAGGAVAAAASSCFCFSTQQNSHQTTAFAASFRAGSKARSVDGLAAWQADS